MNQLPRTALHPYQVEAIEYLCQATDRQVIAIMGAGKTTIALHAIADLKASTALSGPVLVAAPLMIAETVWHTEAAHWEATSGLTRRAGHRHREAAHRRPGDARRTSTSSISTSCIGCCRGRSSRTCASR